MLGLAACGVRSECAETRAACAARGRGGGGGKGRVTVR